MVTPILRSTTRIILSIPSLVLAQTVLRVNGAMPKFTIRVTVRKRLPSLAIWLKECLQNIVRSRAKTCLRLFVSILVSFMTPQNRKLLKLLILMTRKRKKMRKSNSLIFLFFLTFIPSSFEFSYLKNNVGLRKINKKMSCSLRVIFRS